MKTFITILAISFPFFLTAQQTITWKGGTPGKNNDWNEARNWDIGQVPGHNDHTIIRQHNNGHDAHPIIRGVVQVASVEIQSGAQLEVASSGKLIVDGEYTYSEGIAIYGGRLVSEGEIVLREVDEGYLAECEPVVVGRQVVYYSKRYDYEFSVLTSQN